jgi:hypothetical protein
MATTGDVFFKHYKIKSPLATKYAKQQLAVDVLRDSFCFHNQDSMSELIGLFTLKRPVHSQLN